jgi:hypothetical protein
VNSGIIKITLTDDQRLELSPLRKRAVAFLFRIAF